MTIPVAGASVGSALRFGSAGVSTFAATVAPEGWDANVVGGQGAVYHEGESGAAIWMGFNAQYPTPNPTNVSFVFGGNPVLAGLSGGSFGKLGAPRVANLARQLLVGGVAPPVFGRGVAYHFGLNGIADFKFEESYVTKTAQNIGFYFGGGALTTGVTLDSTLKVGSPTVVNVARLVAAKTVGSVTLYGGARVGFYGPVEIKFEGTGLAPTGQNAPFIFGEGAPIAGAGLGGVTKFGVPWVVNYAKTVAPKGVGSLGFGRGKVYARGANGASVEFLFLQGYSPYTPLNVPFYFEWVNYIDLIDKGIDSLAFGINKTWLFHTYVQQVDSHQSSEFGTAFVENWAEFAVVPPGIPATGFGTPEAKIAPRYYVEIDIVMQPPLIEVQALYDSAVARPHVNLTVNSHQVADHLNAGKAIPHQVSGKFVVGNKIKQRKATITPHGLDVAMPNNFKHVDQQRILPMGQGDFARPILSDSFRDGSSHARKFIESLHQNADVARYSPQVLWRNMLRDRRKFIGVPSKGADPHELGWLQDFDVAQPAELGWKSAYQNAVLPKKGKSPVTPVIPGKVCYIPDANLVFKNLGEVITPYLEFVCEVDTRPLPVDPRTVLVPVRKVYIVMNEVRLFKVDGNIELDVQSLTLNMDMDSWSWGFTATLPGVYMDMVYSATPRAPIELKAIVNGEQYILLGEQVSRNRSFGKSSVSVSGRGHSAYLATPFSQGLNFSNPDSSTAQQLMANALTTNGVSIGWQLDWNIPDWFVPGGTWSSSGSYMDAIASILKAGGAFVYSHPSEKRLAINPRYPSMPWNWGQAVPDFVIPSDVIEAEGVKWEEFPMYNGVYVTGVSQGVLAHVKRAGTAGDVLAPMFTDQLITHADAARAAGGNILAMTGKVATLSLSMPVLDSTGIIKPGKMIKYQDNGTDIIGLVKGVSLSMTGLPNLRQNLEVEVHG